MKWRSRLIGLLQAVVIFGSATADTPTGTHDDLFSKDGLFRADVSSLTDTQLVAHPEVPLDPNKNILWCGTLQLAWNEAIRLVGEKLCFADQPPLVDLLNQQDFRKPDLDAGSFVAIADFERNNVEDEIGASLEKIFHGAASPELIPTKPRSPNRDAFVAYAYLFKNLVFATPFEDNKPLLFGGAEVKNFGFTNKWSRHRDKLTDQVSICCYDSENNFIIKLKTKGSDDELILAKIPPSRTFLGAVNYVLQRAANPEADRPGIGDSLSIPKLNFDLQKDFSSLEGLVLQPSQTAHVKNLRTSTVKQLVRFQLDENGAILKSEGEMGMVGSAMEAPPKIRTMIFDRPFLVLMKRWNSPHAYFALWVGNESLLVPAK